MKQIYISCFLFFVKVSFGGIQLEANGPQGNAAYVHECEEAGIIIPEVVDCEEGTEVPIWKTICRDGKNIRERVTSENYKSLALEAKENLLTCDNPSYLHYQENQSYQACRPGSKIQLINNKNGSQCVLFCRKYLEESKKMYDDINMICHQPNNGATCFFNSNLNKAISGEKINSPARDMRWAKSSEISNMRSNRSCRHCHDNDPFLITPHIAELGIVPSMDTKHKRDPKGKYYVVGKDFQNDSWQKVYAINSPKVTACTSCHRIGSRNSCEWTKLMTGYSDLNHHSKFHPAETLECSGARKARYMPPGGSLSLNDREAIEFILNCCSEVEQPDFPKKDSPCGWKKIDSRLEKNEIDSKPHPESTSH